MASFNQIISVSIEPVGPDDEPISLSEAKNFCKIDEPDDDVLVSTLIVAARLLCEDYSNISFVKRKVTATISNGNGYAYLPFGPVHDVESINGKSPDGGAVTTGEWKQLIYPVCDRVTLEYDGGYESGQLPNDLRIAWLNAIYFLYDNRSESGLSPTSKSILNQYRRV